MLWDESINQCQNTHTQQNNLFFTPRSLSPLLRCLIANQYVLYLRLIACFLWQNESALTVVFSHKLSKTPACYICWDEMGDGGFQ